MARQPLGRGLDALLGDSSSPVVQTKESSAEIDVDLIEPNPEQPRADFSPEHLADLAASIRSNGIVQPIVVRPHNGRYQIVAGERRWRAAQLAGLRRVPTVVKEIPDDKLLEIALVENIQRQELNPIEEANAYRKLIENIGLTQEQVAERVGKERTLITTTMRLLRLPEEIQRFITQGKLSLSHGRALLMSDDPKIQRAVANQILDKGLSVRDTERAVKRASSTSDKAASVKRSIILKDANMRAAETRLVRHFSTGVKITPSPKGSGGRIEIEYYGIDDLSRIYDLLIKEK
jgi:ParB family chromosome partitioning protein